jgi:hypothetical protein
VSADPARLLADFNAGRPVPVLELLAHGIRAHEADLARGRRGAARARYRAPRGRTAVGVVEAVFKGVRALEASVKRGAARSLSAEQRARDEVAVLEALPLANRTLGGPASDEAKIKFISERTGISVRRVEKVMQLINIHRGVQPPANWGLAVKISCTTCENFGRRNCMRHASGERLLAAVEPPRPDSYYPALLRAGAIGIGPLKKHTT